jgi:hypothetical protein
MNFRKSIHLGRFSIPAVLLVAILVASVAAAAYVVLSATMTATVVANPKVSFFSWPSTKLNTFAYSVNIFPLIKTVDENLTYGIWNSDTGVVHQTGLRVSSITQQGTNIESFLVKVYNATTVWSLTTVSSSYTVVSLAPGKYTIWLEITGKSGASGNSVFTLDMQVFNP